jgi:hypothetical protein
MSGQKVVHGHQCTSTSSTTMMVVAMSTKATVAIMVAPAIQLYVHRLL